MGSSRKFQTKVTTGLKITIIVSLICIILIGFDVLNEKKATTTSHESETYPINVNGQTYGSAMLAESYESMPDLVLVKGKNNVLGYIYKDDFLCKTSGDYEKYSVLLTDEDEIHSLREEYSNEPNSNELDFYKIYYDIPMYDENYENLVGTFTIYVGTYPYKKISKH